MCTLIYVPIDKSPFKYIMSWTTGLTVADMIHLSGIQKIHPVIDRLTPGIFAHRVELSTLIKPGDRIELYRPLMLDPKEKRRQIVKKSIRSA